MKVTATTEFLHGTKRYEEGKKYDVDDVTAGYFIGNGWAVGPDGVAVANDGAAEVSLEIDSVTITTDGETL